MYGNFFDEIGLTGLSEDEKLVFVQHYQDELDARVGKKVLEGLPEDKIREYELVVAGDQTMIDNIMVENPDFKNDPIYNALAQTTNLPPDSKELIDEYAIVKWLNVNFPEYSEVVREISAGLKQEVKTNSRMFQ